MNTTEALQRFEEVKNHYIEELNGFSMEQLKRQPSENEWSIGQMYLHLINATLYMHLRNIDLCMTRSKDSIVSQGEKTEAGQAIFDQGSFPSVRVHVPPSPQYTPGQPESKDQLVQGLNVVMQKMKEIEPTIENAPLQNTVSHPRLGALNAKEWFMLIEMHYRHHLLQKERLKKELEIKV
ncbi:DinB family protein [Paenibacillus sp. GP183]|uniref:DinB family protein n=1 Tax=Paenibacillus sp. GP183 TaxID=1882751 RepID=UPI000895F5D7|nr:DinB family protein [Paenibacillus sp. GP183]SEB82935.1 DinB superfamily protein [Paenibacillus sp. GP183]